ncbi:hypothetical protein L2E82_24741 [Cichorium intybus]|uniref:Uncharacterized protein n=1 Tax=Cichorium intybus TaxID=13427 RepID=A0ACB9E1W2_CICIN|nr:hypothetical protein L2E82_24741 [Cichorium intybus]
MLFPRIFSTKGRLQGLTACFVSSRVFMVKLIHGADRQGLFSTVRVANAHWKQNCNQHVLSIIGPYPH